MTDPMERNLEAEVDGLTRLSDAVALLRSVVFGEVGVEVSDKLPHVILADLDRHAALPQRQLIQEAVLAMLRELVSRSVRWHDDAAVALLLASKSICAYRSEDALTQITRILRKPTQFSPRVAIAAGQAALMLGFRGDASIWQSLQSHAGSRGVPVTIGGLERCDWHALISWLPRVLGEPYAERTFLNALPTLSEKHSTEEMIGLITEVNKAMSEAGRAEVMAFVADRGLTTAEQLRPSLDAIINGALCQMLESLRAALQMDPALTTKLRGHFRAASYYLNEIVMKPNADPKLQVLYFDCDAHFAAFDELQNLNREMPTSGDAIVEWVRGMAEQEAPRDEQ